MNKLALLLIFLAFSLAAPCQTRKNAAKKRTTTSVSRKKTSSKSKTKSKTKKPTTKKNSSGNATISGLKSQRADIQRNIRLQEQKLRSNQLDVKKRLQNLLVLNSEIYDKKKALDTIRKDITTLDTTMARLNRELVDLNLELADRKEKFVKSMRYMHRNRSIQNKLMFIFGAKNFSQMYRRMRFVKEYASYQSAQGEMVKQKQKVVEQKYAELAEFKRQKSSLLSKGEHEKRALESKQTEQQTVVSSLQRQQRTIQGIIDSQKKKDAAINAQIDRLVAIEVEKARQRAIAEAKRKAKEAEAAKKRQEELARKKAEAEAAARENQKRIAAAKERERKAKEAARQAAKRNEQERQEAERLARQAEEDRKQIERQSEEDNKSRQREMAQVRKESTLVYNLDAEDRRISGSFESNKGRLPMPISGSYRIVSHFGQYNVEGLHNVTLDNKGINILGQHGAKALSIYDGEVSAVFNLGGTMGVMVRHGSYISVYCNLASVSVHRGQHVSSKQVLGIVGTENVLQFQLRKEKAKLNPEVWLRR